MTQLAKLFPMGVFLFFMQNMNAVIFEVYKPRYHLLYKFWVINQQRAHNYDIVADNPVFSEFCLFKNPTTSSVEMPISFHAAKVANHAHVAPAQLAK